AQVFAVHLPSTSEPAVLKVASGPEVESSLFNEARTLTLLGGAFAPRLFGLGRRPGGLLALAMERIPGPSLRRRLDNGDLDPSGREDLAHLVLSQGARALLQI